MSPKLLAIPVWLVVLWDYFTTGLGVASLFDNRTVLVYMFSYVTALGLSGYVLATVYVFMIEPVVAKAIAIAIWAVMFLFDIYTTFVGNTAVVTDKPFTQTMHTLLNEIQQMSGMQIGLVCLTTFFVTGCTIVASFLLGSSRRAETPQGYSAE